MFVLGAAIPVFVDGAVANVGAMHVPLAVSVQVAGKPCATHDLNAVVEAADPATGTQTIFAEPLRYPHVPGTPPSEHAPPIDVEIPVETATTGAVHTPDAFITQNDG